MKRQSSTRVNKRVGYEVQQLESDRLGKLLNERRYCYAIPAEAYVDGHGFRVSIAIEHEKGHYPTGDDAWIEGDGAARKPWFWGETYEEARKVCEEANARMGITPKDAALIVASTMGGPRS